MQGGLSSPHSAKALRTRRGSPRRPHTFQPFGCLIQRFIAFAESEAHLLRTILRITVKTGTGHRRHADFAHQVLCKREIVRIPEAPDVSHHVIRPAWEEAAETCLLEHRHKPI